MKYFILSAALLSATAANAQKLIVGINGGAAITRSWQKNVGYEKIF
ncbi:MAG: hypothetical protein JNL72_01305 [Flavipsychrobacter sp.]|nr:hypothetical protein [Flavipsychrobacter sp.]